MPGRAPRPVETKCAVRVTRSQLPGSHACLRGRASSGLVLCWLAVCCIWCMGKPVIPPAIDEPWRPSSSWHHASGSFVKSTARVVNHVAPSCPGSMSTPSGAWASLCSLLQQHPQPCALHISLPSSSLDLAVQSWPARSLLLHCRAAAHVSRRLLELLAAAPQGLHTSSTVLQHILHVGVWRPQP